MVQNMTTIYAWNMLKKPPEAVAQIHGSQKYPDIKGKVFFWQTERGVIVAVEAEGLPQEGLEFPILAFHIHEGSSCSGNSTDPFSASGMHYNPESKVHPEHAGDLPPLFVNHGRVWEAVLTDRFTVSQIIGRTVIIHAGKDDFTTQPSGNAGEKIACGEIKISSF